MSWVHGDVGPASNLRGFDGEASDSRDTEEGGRELTRFGSYVVLEKIANGGMAEIYKVHAESRPNWALALKRIRPDLRDELEFRRMLIDEAEITSRLDHPNVARVYGIEQVGEQLALIQEYVDGLDLTRLKRNTKDRVPLQRPEVAIHIVREVLEGLDFAHNVRDEQGEYLNIVHRDVSPGNVMVDAEGLVRIIDFGIARARNRLSKTEAGSVKGKFRYMAPEQIKGDVVGPHTDVYSTAVLLWELLTGQRIYDDVNVGHMMIRVANAQIPRLSSMRSDLPTALHTVFGKATALDTSCRYRSARAFADALDSVLFEYDEERCRRELRTMVLSAKASDRQKGLDRAVVRARFAAGHDLEGALLKALETPDRILRVPIDEARFSRAESRRSFSTSEETFAQSPVL